MQITDRSIVHRLPCAGFSLPQFLLCIASVCTIAYIGWTVYIDTERTRRNDVRNEVVQEYAAVFALLRTDRGSYPKVDAACLGDYPDDRCGVVDYDPRGDIREVEGLNARIRPFVEMKPGSTVVGSRTDGVSSAYEGYVYRSPEGSQYGYRIEWMLEGADAMCGLNANAEHRYQGMNITRCLYTEYGT